MNGLQGTFPGMKKQHTMFSLLLLMAMAGCIVFVQTSGAIRAGDESLGRILQVVAVVDSVAGLLIGFNLFKKRMMAARKSISPPAVRLAEYARACRQWWLLILMPGFVTFAFFIFTGDYAFIALGAMHLLILLVFRPRKENLQLLLGLSESDLL